MTARCVINALATSTGNTPLEADELRHELGIIEQLHAIAVESWEQLAVQV